VPRRAGGGPGIGEARDRQSEVEHDDAMPRFRHAPHEDVAGLQIAVDEPEVVKRNASARRVSTARETNSSGPSRRMVRDDVVAVDVLHREMRMAGFGAGVQLVDLDEIRMAQCRERCELTLQVGRVVGVGIEKRFEGDARAGTEAVFDEQDSSCSAGTQLPQDREPIQHDLLVIMRGIYDVS
jgi:hypothetical protein